MTVGEVLISILLLTTQVALYSGVVLYFRYKTKNPQQPPSIKIVIPEIVIKQVNEQSKAVEKMDYSKRYEEALEKQRQEKENLPDEYSKEYEDLLGVVNDAYVELVEGGGSKDGS